MMFRTLPHWITLQWFRCKSQWHRELVLKVLRWISINKILSELTILTIPYFTGYMPLCTSEGAVPKEMMAKAFSTGHCDVTVKLTFDLWYNVIILSYIAFVLNSLKISRIGLADICLFMASSCFTEEIRRVGGPQCGPGHVCLHIAKKFGRDTLLLKAVHLWLDFSRHMFTSGLYRDGGCTLKTRRLNGSVLVPDTTGHLQRACGQSQSNSMCFGWLAGLSPGLHFNYRIHFQETWMEDGSWPKTDRIGFGYKYITTNPGNMELIQSQWYLF